MSRNIALVLVAFSLAAVSGCGSSEAKPYLTATVPVKGKVIYQGKNLTGGSIIFEPEGAGREARGTIQADGTFTLSTYAKDDGAVLGPHRVAVDGKSNDGKALPIKFKNFSSSKYEIEITQDKAEYAIDLK